MMIMMLLGGLIVGSDQGGCGREGVQMGHFGGRVSSQVAPLSPYPTP